MDLLIKLKDLLTSLTPQLLSLGVTLFSAFIIWFFRPKVNLIWGRPNNNIHFVQSNAEKTEIYCEKYFLQNTGMKAVTDVQFVMSYRPDDVSVFPSRNYTENTNPAGHFIVLIPFISPGELVVIDVVYIQKRAANIKAVICNEMAGKNVEFITNRFFGKVFSVSALALFLCGIAFVIQVIGKIGMEIIK